MHTDLRQHFIHRNSIPFHYIEFNITLNPQPHWLKEQLLRATASRKHSRKTFDCSHTVTVSCIRIRYCELELRLLKSIPTLVAELPYALRLPSFIKIAITAVGEVLYYRALLQPCGIRDFWEYLLQNSQTQVHTEKEHNKQSTAHKLPLPLNYL